MKYRPEIDGLRAIAVLPVIFFHAGFEIFKGGFIGVDIFFVISGYLITRILIEEIENKKFSLVGFYERRARRLLPALFFVILICIPFAWMWMLPDPLENFGQSLVSTSLFSNNFLLMLTSTNYWELTGEFKPLLHTWSLAVEEQYYLIFPIFLMLFLQLGKKSIFWIIVLLTALSLFLGQWLSEINPLFNFYFTLSRAWELLAGSLTAFIVNKRGVVRNEMLALLGLLTILFSLFFYDETLPLPSFLTLIPVMGTILLILYAEGKTATAKILSSKFFVGIGLISYSLYLWHQPLFAFNRIYLKEPLTDYGSYLIIIITLFLGFITWKFIETPFRKKNKFTSKTIFSLSIFMMLAVSAFGLYLDRTNGVPQRLFTDDSYKRSSHEIKISEVKSIDLNKIEPKDLKNDHIFIFGDSFATDLAYLIEYKYPIDLNYTLIQSGMPEKTICNNNILTKAKALNVTSILFAYDEGFDVSCIENLIDEANSMKIEILFFGTKQFGYNLNWLARLEQNERHQLCQTPVIEAIAIDSRDNKRIPKENYFSFFNNFLKNNCIPVTNMSGELLSSDRKHFTISGLEFFADEFFQNKNVKRVLNI